MSVGECVLVSTPSPRPNVPSQLHYQLTEQKLIPLCVRTYSLASLRSKMISTTPKDVKEGRKLGVSHALQPINIYKNIFHTHGDTATAHSVVVSIRR